MCRAKRIEKEEYLSQKFWSQANKANVPSPPLPQEETNRPRPSGSSPGSVAETVNTVVLKERLDKLESELALERERRAKVENELTELLKSKHVETSLGGSNL